ncbi:MAG: aspartate/glutamate racemase family protein [Pseudomonadota bacterium]
MHIGLIGGIGPAATISYYSKLVDEFKKAGLPLKLTITHADISVLAHNASNNQRDAQAKIFAEHLNQLAAAGCDIALITSLTGHFCFKETQLLSPIELVNGTAIIDRYCEEKKFGALGILGSPPVLNTQLFGLLNACEIVVPSTGLEDIGNAYMEMARSGSCSEELRFLFFGAGTAMVKDNNADAVLLAGTDLGLAFDDQDPGFMVIDALELHVGELVLLASK